MFLPPVTRRLSSIACLSSSLCRRGTATHAYCANQTFSTLKVALQSAVASQAFGFSPKLSGCATVEHGSTDILSPSSLVCLPPMLSRSFHQLVRN